MTRRFVLDTDVLTLYQRGNPNVVRNAQSHPLDLLAVTIISRGAAFRLVHRAAPGQENCSTRPGL